MGAPRSKGRKRRAPADKQSAGNVAPAGDALIIDGAYDAAVRTYTGIERIRNPKRLPWGTGGSGSDTGSIYVIGADGTVPALQRLYVALNRVCEHYGWQCVSDESGRPCSHVRDGGTIPAIPSALLNDLEGRASFLRKLHEGAPQETGEPQPSMGRVPLGPAELVDLADRATRMAQWIRECLPLRASNETPATSANADAVAVWHGNGRLQIGEQFIALEGNEANVMQSLVELRAATESQLVDKSGVTDAGRVLRRLWKGHADLARHVTLPGKRNTGGYQTDIRAVSDSRP
jgi:hypothetical protein